MLAHHDAERDGGLWYALILYRLWSGTGDLEELAGRLKAAREEIEADELFEITAKNCPYLEVFQNGNAYEHICNHPSRRDPSDWVTCERTLCPLQENSKGQRCKCKGFACCKENV